MKIWLVTKIDTTLPYTTNEVAFKKRIDAVAHVVEMLRQAALPDAGHAEMALDVFYTLDGEEKHHQWYGDDVDKLPIGVSDVGYLMHTFNNDFVRYTIKALEVLS